MANVSHFSGFSLESRRWPRGNSFPVEIHTCSLPNTAVLRCRLYYLENQARQRLRYFGWNQSITCDFNFGSTHITRLLICILLMALGARAFQTKLKAMQLIDDCFLFTLFYVNFKRWNALYACLIHNMDTIFFPYFFSFLLCPCTDAQTANGCTNVFNYPSVKGSLTSVKSSKYVRARGTIKTNLESLSSLSSSSSLLSLHAGKENRWKPLHYNVHTANAQVFFLDLFCLSGRSLFNSLRSDEKKEEKNCKHSNYFRPIQKMK